MSPLIVTAPDGSFKLATSSAGGSRIISAQAQIVRTALDFGVSALEALRAPRVHDQIYPAVTTLERDSPEIGFKGCVDRGLTASLAFELILPRSCIC